MGKLVIHPEKIQDIKALVAICPFGAMQEQGGTVEITAACRLCKLCVKKGGGAVTFEEEEQQAQIDKSKWQGVAVYIDHVDGRVHPVSYELWVRRGSWRLRFSRKSWPCSWEKISVLRLRNFAIMVLIGFLSVISRNWQNSIWNLMPRCLKRLSGR